MDKSIDSAAMELPVFVIHLGRTISQWAAMAVRAPDAKAAKAAVRAKLDSGVSFDWEDGDEMDTVAIDGVDEAEMLAQESLSLAPSPGKMLLYAATHTPFVKAYLDAALQDARWRAVVFKIPKYTDIPEPIVLQAYNDCRAFIDANEAHILKELPDFNEAVVLNNSTLDVGVAEAGEAFYMCRNLPGAYFGGSPDALALMEAAQAMGVCRLGLNSFGELYFSKQLQPLTTEHDEGGAGVLSDRPAA